MMRKAVALSAAKGNANGPTEASNYVTHYIVEAPPVRQTTIPIGKPLRNFRVYILGKDSWLGPTGQPLLFPPGLGFGLSYRELAILLADFLLYSFHFIEAGDWP
jgi:hypothetical protein